MAKRIEPLKRSRKAKATEPEAKTLDAPAPGAASSTAALDDEIVEFEAAQALLKTTRSTLYRWIRQDHLRAMKAGRQWRFRREDLRRFLEGESAELALPVSAQPFVDSLRAALNKADPKTHYTFAPQMPLLRQAGNLVLLLAIRLNASDVHITPNRGADGLPQVPVRLRVDGVLRTVAMLEPPLLVHFVKEWKDLARCNAHETTRPQEGHSSMPVGESSYDLRYCFLPSSLGESVVVRVTKIGADRLTLEQCGFLPEQSKRIEDAVRAPNGLVLFTGPMGSGKSTVMLSALACVDARESSVMSLEMSPESFLPWVTQVGAREAAGLPPHAVLQHVRHADPDVIAFGEIRDLKTLRLATEFVETGHLILATLNANDAVAALRRLLEMGESPTVLGSTLRLVVAQRLMRLVCPECAKPVRPEARLRKRFDAILKSGGVAPASLTPNFREGTGCPACHESAFRGRCAYAELLTMTPRLAELLRTPDAQAPALHAEAIREGMVPMSAILARRAYEGATSIREALRLLGQS